MDSIKQNLGSYYYARYCKIYSLFKPTIGYLPHGFLVSNLIDKKGYIKTGNQRVIEARLAYANFFWFKNKD